MDRRHFGHPDHRLELGGTHSLSMAYPELDRRVGDFAGRIVRLNIGLEEPADLIDDLRSALGKMDGQEP